MTAEGKRCLQFFFCFLHVPSFSKTCKYFLPICTALCLASLRFPQIQKIKQDSLCLRLPHCHGLWRINSVELRVSFLAYLKAIVSLRGSAILPLPPQNGRGALSKKKNEAKSLNPLQMILRPNLTFLTKMHRIQQPQTLPSSTT